MYIHWSCTMFFTKSWILRVKITNPLGTINVYFNIFYIYKTTEKSFKIEKYEITKACDTQLWILKYVLLELMKNKIVMMPGVVYPQICRKV